MNDVMEPADLHFEVVATGPLSAQEMRESVPELVRLIMA